MVQPTVTVTSAPADDAVSNVLKWILLATAVGCFALFAWATVLTYERAAPQPDRFVTAGGKTLFTNDDVVAGKVGFQKADLMDYGSLYGMGSYFGQDYTAYTLIGLARRTEDNIARVRFDKPFASLTAEQQFGVRDTMRKQLQGVDLTKDVVVIPDELAGAITGLRETMAKNLGTLDLTTGW